MTDPNPWPTINAEAAAIPGGIPWRVGMVDECDATCTFVDEDGTVWFVDDVKAAYVAGHQLADLSCPGTRGHLRAALGSPTILTDRRLDGVYRATVVVDVHDRYTAQHHGKGDTRDEAEARALIAYARANGGWTLADHGTPDTPDTETTP
jgi:hypothetical protein